MNADEIRFLINLFCGALATVALAPIFVALYPVRHASAVAQVENSPGRCLALGIGPVLLVIVAVWGLAVLLFPIGSGVSLVIGGLMYGLGAGITGRTIGARLSESSSTLQQTLIGSALVSGSSIWPGAGLVIYLVAVAVGVGGWMMSSRKV